MTIGSAGTFTLLDGGVLSTDAVVNDGTFGIDNASDLTVDTVLSGTGGLLKTGAGNATLAGANTMTGTATVDAGTLTGTAASLGLGTSYVVNGGTLAVTDTFALGSNGATTATVDGSTAVLQAASLSGGAATGTTAILSVANGGNVIVGSGADALAVGTAGTGTLVYGSLSDPTDAAAGTVTASSIALGSGGTIDFSHNQNTVATTLVFDTTVTGSGTIEALAGRTALTGDMSGFTGATIASGGNLLLETALAGPVTIGADGTFTITDEGTFTGALTNSGKLAFDTTAAKTVVADFTGSGSLQMDGTGTLTLTGTNALTGGVTVDSGTLAGTIASLGSGAYRIVGGTLALTTDTDASLASAISGAGTFTKLDAGTLTYTGDGSAFTGTTAIQAGGLTLASTLGGSTTVASGATFTLADGSSFTGAIVNDGTLAFTGTASRTVASALSGTGAIVQDGTGTMTLTGVNTWTGGLTVDAGTLAGTVASLGSGPYRIVGGTLAYTAASDETLSAALSGAGTFAKLGAGTLTYASDGSAFTGAFAIDAGALRLNGSLGGSVSVGSGATLYGNGSMASLTVLSGGTIAPGNSIGTLTVTGNATFAAGSTYLVEINAAGASDLISVGGTATLNGATVEVVKLSSAFASGTRYTILTAAGGITGTFAGPVQETAPFLDLLLSYDSTHAYLDITRALDFQAVAQTRNQSAVAIAANALGSGNSVYDAILVSSDAAAARTAFDALSGEIHASARTSAIEDSGRLRAATLSRLTDTNADGAWGQVFSGWGTATSVAGSARVKNDTTGFVMGADKTLGDGAVRVGVAGGYTNTQLQTNAPGSRGTVSTIHGLVYAGADIGGVMLRAGAGYGAIRNKLHRDITFDGYSDAASSHYDGSVGQGFAEVTAPVALFGAKLEPYANVAYVHTKGERFTESGGAAALSGRSNGAGVTLSTVGFRMTTPVDRVFSLHLDAGYQHAYGDVTAPTTLQFATGTTTFDVSGSAISRNAGDVALEGRWQLSPGINLAAGYNGTYGTAGYDHGARARVSFAF